MTDRRPALSIPVSLDDVYNAVCPDCRGRLLELIVSKAGKDTLGELLRQSLEARAQGDPGEPSAHDD